MEEGKCLQLLKSAVMLMSAMILLKVQAEEFRGRHVCNRQQTITQPMPVQQSYTRAVFRKDLQRVIYQTAFRTIFRMQIHAEMVPGCCPGWEKRSARDVSCLKPVCNEECENGGQCVGPDMCLCAEGYTGYRCQLDVDECSGRNTCQQKCTNLPGSYECSCQEGFKLAKDEYSCDLCLTCTKEFQNMQAQLETVNGNSLQGDVIQEIRKQINNLTEVKAEADTVIDIQKQVEDLKNTALPDDRLQELQKNVDILQNKIKEVDAIQELNKKIDILEESNSHNEEFQAIQHKIENLQASIVHADQIKELNDTVRRLQEDDSQAKKIQDLQQQIAEILLNKSEQEKLQVEKFDSLHKELEQLRGVKASDDSVKEIQDQLNHLVRRIQELETDKAVLKSNLTTAVDRYEAAFSALQSIDASTDHATTESYDEGHYMGVLGRLASLSEQISILEEKMADCACNQDYPTG